MEDDMADALGAIDQPAADDTEADVARELAEAARETDADQAEGTASGGEGDDPGADIRQAIEEHGAAIAEGEAKVKAEQDWNTEFDQLYRDAITAHGLTPEQAVGQGITREAAARRLFSAERMLKSDPAGGMAWLARNYAATLGPEQRAAVAHGVLAQLGFESAAKISDQERAELNHWRGYQAQQQQDMQQVVAAAEQQVAAFAASPQYPHFAQVRQMMGRIMQAGLAHDMQSAYALACQHARLPDPAAAANAEQARRAAVQRARAAATPRTQSTRVAPADDDVGDESIEATLRKEYAAREVAGRARI